MSEKKTILHTDDLLRALGMTTLFGNRESDERRGIIESGGGW
ncbi:hypothetical protein BH10ACT9_BH10ACT9_28270 [soil metagenome]